MIVTWRLLSILSLVSYTESECSSTSYYRNCWIRRFPGLHVDAEESQRRGAQLLQLYRGESAQNCSRACCLTSNFSCNVAVFHYNTTQDSVNCFHLHCPTLQSCILHQGANVILYNVTKGMDPDLLIFAKSFPSNVQILPQLGTHNMSDLSGTDKRQFNPPQMEPSSSAHPAIHTTSPKTSTNAPTSSFPISTPPPHFVYSTQENQNTLPASAIQRSTTLKRSYQLISTRIITDPSTKAFPTTSSTIQPSSSFTNRQTGSMPQPAFTSITTITPSQPSSQLTSSSTFFSQVGLLGTISPTFSSGHTTTSTPESSTVQTTTVPVPLTSALESNTVATTTMPVPLITTVQSNTEETTTMPVPLTSTLEKNIVETSTMPVPLTSTPESSAVEIATMPVPLTTTLQNSTRVTTTLTVPLSSALRSSTGKTTTMLVPLSNAPQSITGETTTTSVHLSRISRSSTGQTTAIPVPLSSTPQSSTQDTTTMPLPFSSIPQRGVTTTIPVPLLSILQSSKGGSTAQLSSAKESLALTPHNPGKTMTGHVTTTEPQVMTNIFTTTSWSYNQPINTQSTASPQIEKSITPSSTMGGLSQGYANINLVTTDVPVNTIRSTTLDRIHISANHKTISGLNTAPTTPTIAEDSQPFPNDTKGYISRNVTTGNSPQPVSDGGLTQVWHLAANTVLVALATCAALACGCCCSVLMAASWRGRRRRKGRYQTTLRGKKGSMRLIKYVFVRESS